jgi:tetratricopeptide (TPR) repeat protein
MRRILLLSLGALLTAVAGFPQSDTWQLRMDEAARAETAGDYAKALTAYQSVSEIAETLDPRDPRRALTWNSLGAVYDALARFTDAEGAYRRALAAAVESKGKSSEQYALVLANLGSLYLEMGQNTRAGKCLRDSLAVNLGADDRRRAIARISLAEVLSRAGKFDEAAGELTESIAVLEKLPADWGELASALNNLGAVRFEQKNYPAARRVLLRALAMEEQHVGRDHPLLLRALNNLASVAGRMGDREEAGQRLRRAVDIAETRLGLEHPMYGTLLANYAAYLRETGDKARAKTLQAQSTRILKNSGRSNGIGSVVDISALQRK